MYSSSQSHYNTFKLSVSSSDSSNTGSTAQWNTFSVRKYIRPLKSQRTSYCGTLTTKTSTARSTSHCTRTLRAALLHSMLPGGHAISSSSYIDIELPLQPPQQVYGYHYLSSVPVAAVVLEQQQQQQQQHSVVGMSISATCCSRNRTVTCNHSLAYSALYTMV
eukprot:2984-Heterococcus_DN1.PRE.5